MGIKKSFENSIKKGTGQALLLAEKYPNKGFSKEIIASAIKNNGYDPQLEGSRAVYIWELILKSNKKAKIRRAILNALASERKNTWALVQLFDLATLYAKQGDKEAKKAIYKRFFKKIISGSNWCGYSNIIDLDGLNGLLHIASVMGKAIIKVPDNWQDSAILNYFQDKYPEIDVFAALEQEAEKDANINAYLKAVKSSTTKSDYKPRVYSYEVLLERIENSQTAFIYPRFYTNIPDTDVRMLADSFLTETDKPKQAKYLSIFSKIKFPYNYQPILELAKKKPDCKSRRTEFAVKALTLFSGNDIRALFDMKVANPNKLCFYTDLLITHFKKGDEKILKSLVLKTDNQDILHNLSLSFIKIFNKNKTSACQKPLVELYKKLACSMCRESIAKILIENNVLPEKIKKELAFDCSEDIRQLVNIRL